MLPQFRLHEVTAEKKMVTAQIEKSINEKRHQIPFSASRWYMKQAVMMCHEVEVDVLKLLGKLLFI